MSLIYPMSPARWTVLQSLADATEPLDRRQLAALTNVSASVVYHSLIRPVKEGWVTITHVPSDQRNIMKNLYRITGTGRKELAAYLKRTNA